VKEVTLNRLPVWFRYVAIALLVVGIIFRFVNLNHKLFWHDEIYTGFRSAGYVRTEIHDELIQTQPIPIRRLKDYVSLKPNSTYTDTLRSLATEDSQHPPLYFALTRLWMQVFGSPIRWFFGSQVTVLRSLPMLLSLLAIPAAFALAWELFHSKTAALFAAMLVALSPLDVLFAQTARQYSLLTVLVLVSQWLLLRAMRLSQTRPKGYRVSSSYQNWRPWLWYCFSLVLGLYTHPFFCLTLIAQAVLVGGIWLSDRAKQMGLLLKFSGAVLVSILAFAPWLWMIYRGKESVAATTGWLNVTPSIGYYLKLWLLSFTSLFIDLDFGINNPITFLLRLPFLILTVVGVILICRQCDRRAWLTVLTMIFVPFLLLAGADFVFGGLRSTVSRYLISSYPGAQLAMAWLLATLCTRGLAKLPSLYEKSTRSVNRQLLGSIALGMIALGSITSLTASAASYTWWNKDLSYFNGAIAQVINQTDAPLLVSDPGDDFTNLGDLISLSYLVKAEVPLVYLGDDLQYLNSPEFTQLQAGRSLIVFRPSKQLRSLLEAKFRNLQPYPNRSLRLWTLSESSAYRFDLHQQSSDSRAIAN